MGAGVATFDHVFFKSLLFCCSSSCSLWAPSLNDKSYDLQTCEGGTEEGGKELRGREEERGFNCFPSLPELSIIPLVWSFSLPFSSVVKLSFFLVIVVVVVVV